MSSNKAKAHTRYRTKNSSIVPGVTTITSELGWNSRVLINWANRIGLQGIDSTAYKDDKADIGKLGHSMITDWLLKEKTNTDDYSKNQISAAENSALSFYEWAKGKKIKPILIEERLVSERHKYGGQADIYAEIDGELELIDLKTGSGIYNEMIIQVAAYRQLLVEYGHKVSRVRILNIPRAESETFDEKLISFDHLQVAWEIFLNCLSTYQLKKKLK